MHSMSPESRVSQVFENIRHAMLTNDARTLLLHVAEDYRGSDAGGREHGRDDFIAAYGPGGATLSKFDTSKLRTSAWADTVLIRGIVDLRGAYQGQEFAHRSCRISPIRMNRLIFRAP